MGKADDFMKLVQEGKIADARAMLGEEKAKEKFAPDDIIQKDGHPPVFKCRGRIVVPDVGGSWKLKNQPRKSKKSVV